MIPAVQALRQWLRRRRTKPVYHFHVDDRPCESHVPRLTAMEVKALADVPLNHNLLCMAGKPPDRALRDAEFVEVNGKEFYSVPLAFD